MSNTRIERDFLGERQIGDECYYGIQTLRAKDNFHITGIPISSEPAFIRAFGMVKKAAALANHARAVGQHLFARQLDQSHVQG